MSQVYRHIWSKTLERMVVVPECVSGEGRKSGRWSRMSVASACLAAPLLLAGVGSGFAQFNIDGGATETVNGGGGGTQLSPWVVGNDLRVGYLGVGELVILNGGVVSNYGGFVGYHAGSQGTASVTGAGSSWSSPNGLGVGWEGVGTLTVSDGAAVSAGTGFIGQSFGSVGAATFESNSQANFSSGLKIGNRGSSTLTITGGAAVNVQAGAGTAHIAENAGSGTLNIGSASGGLAAAAGILNAATVRFGDGSGRIVFNHTSGAYNFSARITGAGEIRQEAGSTILLSNANNWSGTTLLSGGELIAGSTGAFSGMSAFTVDGGKLDLNNFDQSIRGLAGGGGEVSLGSAKLSINQLSHGTFAGSITGAGSLAKAGMGTMTLTGDASHSGGTTISAGTLSVGDGGTSGSIAGDITNNAAMVFNRSDDTTFAGAISGTGTLQKLGAGTTTLTGDASYSGGTTISAGTLQIGGGGTSGSISGDIVNNAALAFNRSDDLTFAGDISGSGTLEKLGTGKLDLTGNNTYTGATTVNGGILDIASGGSIASSATTVNGGGLVVNGVAGQVNVLGGFLGGAGTVGATTIGAGGTLAPGNSIGTITVNGSLAFAPGSTYQVEVSPSAADRTNVTAIGGPGTADLSGATVVTTYEPGTYVARQYVIVNAEGGVSGEFDGLNGTAPTGFNHSLSYDANNAYLNLTLLMAGWSGLNQNQQAVADALTGYFDTTGGIPGQFASLTREGLTANSGEVGAAAQGAGIGFGATFIDTIGQPYLAGGSGPNDGGGTQTAYAPASASPVPARFGRMAYAEEELSGKGTAATRAMQLQHRLEAGYGEGSALKEIPYSLWGAALGGGVSLAGNPAIGAQAVSGSAVGLTSGFDYANGATRAGIALGASWSSSNVAGLGAANVGNVSIGLRASHDFGQLYLSGAAAYGIHFATTSRAFAGEIYSAAFTGQSISARAETGWRFRTPEVDIVPFVAGRLVSFSNPAYAETGSGAGIFALGYGAATAVETRSELGLRLNKAIARADGSRTAFSGMLGWAHYFTQGRSVTAGFTGLPGTRFVTQGATGASDTALVSLGVSHRFASGVSLSLDADGEFGAGTVGYTAKGRIGWRW